MGYCNDSKNSVTEGSMTACGINICTRHGKANELAEMLNFCVAASRANLESKVVSLFYDSNSCSCSFELASAVDPYDDDGKAILEIARQTIAQFEWDGLVEHGAPLDDMEL